MRRNRRIPPDSLFLSFVYVVEGWVTELKLDQRQALSKVLQRAARLSKRKSS